MQVSELKDVIINSFPELVGRLDIEADGRLVSIDFPNPRYSVWLSEDPPGHFIVGIGGLHEEYNQETGEANLNAALAEMRAVIQGEIAAVGVKGKETDYLLCKMSYIDAMQKYQYHADTLEIVRFTDGC